MIKKVYMKPAMRTVELKHRTMILAGSIDPQSGINNKLQGRSDPNDEVEQGW